MTFSLCPAKKAAKGKCLVERMETMGLSIGLINFSCLDFVNGKL